MNFKLKPQKQEGGKNESNVKMIITLTLVMWLYVTQTLLVKNLDRN